MPIDSERLWHAIEMEDPRFDGWVFCGVTSTGIYCRPSCPARTPKRENVRFFPTAAAAQDAGFRACKRCRPDATPGSPEWDRRADLVGAAMRLIADGVVDREGVHGLAQRLGYSERHVHRELVALAGAGPLAIARAARAQNARILMETTSLSATEVAFASGFQSVRQFNETVKAVFAVAPTQLRASVGRAGRTPRSSAIVLRLPFRAPLDAQELIAFLNARAVPGVEQALQGAYRRSLRLPHGEGVVELCPKEDHVQASFWLQDLRDLGPATQRSRALLDLDADPVSVLECLGEDELLGLLVRRAPGRRVPGHVDSDELAIRAVLGQQISVAGARTLAGRLVCAYGERLQQPIGEVTHLFPSASALACADQKLLPMPASRRRALIGLAGALAAGELALDAGADRARARRQLLGLPGIGSWTADYIGLRALRDPDAFLPGDLGVRRALEALGRDGRPAAARSISQQWRPYRAYAVIHLWAQLALAPRAATPIRTARQRPDERIVALT
ncbi:MAG TPA: AlkA N-terminal domain-containing protein [Solirubrobacteraceae bacterium]|jgi:AraC family transcriptional regulator of adaptative response / DNA-3-methyladenine glycosylase II|nr:AlkA N-terminal domain-containing protein [Solirubrobacteraceae bacterium]